MANLGPDFRHMSSKNQWITTKMYEQSHLPKAGKPNGGGSGCLTEIVIVIGAAGLLGALAAAAARLLAG